MHRSCPDQPSKRRSVPDQPSESRPTLLLLPRRPSPRPKPPDRRDASERTSCRTRPTLRTSRRSRPTFRASCRTTPSHCSRPTFRTSRRSRPTFRKSSNSAVTALSLCFDRPLDQNLPNAGTLPNERRAVPHRRTVPDQPSERCAVPDKPSDSRAVAGQSPERQRFKTWLGNRTAGTDSCFHYQRLLHNQQPHQQQDKIMLASKIVRLSIGGYNGHGLRHGLGGELNIMARRGFTASPVCLQPEPCHLESARADNSLLSPRFL